MNINLKDKNTAKWCRCLMPKKSRHITDSPTPPSGCCENLLRFPRQSIQRNCQVLYRSNQLSTFLKQSIAFLFFGRFLPFLSRQITEFIQQNQTKINILLYSSHLSLIQVRNRSSASSKDATDVSQTAATGRSIHTYTRLTNRTTVVSAAATRATLIPRHYGNTWSLTVGDRNELIDARQNVL